ncbi:MAG: hypothetical protein UX01_C0017G0005 [Candidatus Collierbacteria bacterium GW2011_GWB2_45_17]|uniref:VWFA domain-containing protein n=1 Tax=Candidatus Collierbacteria bacterium GW2011_GWB2_45_17 TaxID=1618388 RepID=A0A837IG14_9BACT|nr:MAG: hypothetical protein UW48_C0023G0005 [Microgenomates group bacterium GW2011_GWC1_44_23]KKT94531.1 MAG: hypothetical protein UW96_C0020G0006 [Candidatus Collierbacteria bacterium GW2011_GWA1_45_15]KKT98919.1 MAG: hypothetical protein UX01_C0017G0005 [Candidatus Collierbacteria bacterium GW2011_GWB2_45_17]HBC44862.1 hypothetical protein [Candidatus Collierbacteria bacterium]
MTSKSTIIVANLNNTSALANVQHAGATDIGGDQVNLVLRIIDRTGSLLRFRAEMIEAARLNVEALINSKAGNETLMSTWTFNATDGFTIVDGFVKLEDVTPLDSQNYDMQPEDMTNLFDTVYTGLNDEFAGIIAYAKGLKSKGLRVKVTVLVLTDGEDNRSRINPEKIKALTANNEGFYFCLMAFGTGFAQEAAAAMGFPNVREYNASAGELRRMMGEFSKSQVRASQSIVSPNAFFN